MKKILKWGLIGFIGLVVLGAIVSPSDKKTTSPKAEETKKESVVTNTPTPLPSPKENELDGMVSFNNLQFTVTNLNNFEWRNCKFEVNPGLFGVGYYYNAPSPLEGLNIYTIGALQFAKSNGERFNPYQLKAQRFTASCRDQSGELIFGYWEFE